ILRENANKGADKKREAGKHVTKVEEWIVKAIKQEPKLNSVLADLHDFNGHYDKVIAVYRQILDREPENRIALNNLAWLLAMLERGDEAPTMMNKVLEVAGPVPEFLDTRGVVWLQLNKTREALSDLEQAAQSRHWPKLLFHLAQAHLQN